MNAYLVSQAGIIVVGTAISLTLAGICVAFYIKRLEKRLSRLATERGIAKEFAQFGTQVEALSEQVDRLQSDIEWLREDRIISQVVDMARTDLKPRGRAQRLTLTARQRRRPN